jgi:hypothetical protein
LKELGVIEVVRRKTLFYRPVKPTPELVTKLAFLIIPVEISEIEENCRVPETEIVKFQNLESANISEFGVLDFQNLEEAIPKNGSVEFQKLEPNESNRIEANLMNQKECAKRVGLTEITGAIKATGVVERDIKQAIYPNRQKQPPELGEEPDGDGLTQRGWSGKRPRRTKGPQRTDEEIRREFEIFRLPGS